MALFRAIIESNRRLMAINLSESPVLTHWDTMIDYCLLQLQYQTVEKLMIVYLDTRGHLIRSEFLQTGTINTVSVYPREILKQALVLGADAVIVAHNHPSGDVQPSATDKRMTDSIRTILAAANIKLVDHLIIGPRRQVYSFSGHGRLEFATGPLL